MDFSHSEAWIDMGCESQKVVTAPSVNCDIVKTSLAKALVPSRWISTSGKKQLELPEKLQFISIHDDSTER